MEKGKCTQEIDAHVKEDQRFNLINQSFHYAAAVSFNESSVEVQKVVSSLDLISVY